MTDLAVEIVAWIVSDDDLADLIDDRIYPLRLPATPTLPAITYQLVSEPQDPVQDGPGMAEPRYRFKVWTDTYIALGLVTDALAVRFNARHDGPFRSSLVDGTFEDYDIATRRYWRIVDVLGWQPASVGPMS